MDSCRHRPGIVRGAGSAALAPGAGDGARNGGPRASDSIPWVDQVNRVSVNRNGTISARSLLSPAGGVHRSVVRAVSGRRRGILLPPPDFSPQDAEAFPHVRNVNSRRRSRPGWSGGGGVVKGGAKIADRLTPGGDRGADLEAVRLVGIAGQRGKSVSGAALDQVSFELLTSAGSRIQWGKAPRRVTIWSRRSTRRLAGCSITWRRTDRSTSRGARTTIVVRGLRRSRSIRWTARLYR